MSEAREKAKARRARGEGGLYKRGQTWWIRFSAGGRDVRESSGSKNRADAVRLLRRRLSELHHGMLSTAGERVTLDDLERVVLDALTLDGRRSHSKYSGSFVHFKRLMPSKVSRIGPSELAWYVEVRSTEGASPASIQKELAVLRRAMVVAIRSGRLARRPAFPSIRVNNARQGFLPEGKLPDLLAALPPHLRGPIHFAAVTGWRLASEILPLRWSQVSGSEIRLEPGTTKSGEGRVWPLSG